MIQGPPPAMQGGPRPPMQGPPMMQQGGPPGPRPVQGPPMRQGPAVVVQNGRPVGMVMVQQSGQQPAPGPPALQAMRQARVVPGPLPQIRPQYAPAQQTSPTAFMTPSASQNPPFMTPSTSRNTSPPGRAPPPGSFPPVSPQKSPAPQVGNPWNQPSERGTMSETQQKCSDILQAVEDVKTRKRSIPHEQLVAQILMVLKILCKDTRFAIKAVESGAHGTQF